MFRNVRKSHLLAAAISLAMPLSMVMADAPAPSQNGTAQNPPAAAAPQTPVPPGALKHEQVRVLLENMGYQPKVYDNNVGTQFYALQFDRNGWKMSLTVSISEDYSYLWISAPLTAVSDPAKASPQALLKLLEQSYLNGPAYFSFRPNQNRIYLGMAILNKDVTAITLRARIEDFCAIVQQTESYWKEQAVMPNGNGVAQAK